MIYSEKIRLCEKGEVLANKFEQYIIDKYAEETEFYWHLDECEECQKTVKIKDIIEGLSYPIQLDRKSYQ